MTKTYMPIHSARPYDARGTIQGPTEYGTQWPLLFSNIDMQNK